MSLYKKYFDIKQQIKELTVEAKQMEQILFSEVAMSEGETIEESFATFKTMYRPKWKYSDELTAREKTFKEKLKALKKVEELSGKAEKVTDGGFLKMTPVKETK